MKQRSLYIILACVVLITVLALALFFGMRLWSNDGKWIVAPDAEQGNTAEEGESTIVEDAIHDAEVIILSEGSVVIRFYGKGMMEVEGRQVPVQEAMTVSFRDDTKFVGTKREDIVVGDRVNVEIKRDTNDESTRVEAISIQKSGI